MSATVVVVALPLESVTHCHGAAFGAVPMGCGSPLVSRSPASTSTKTAEEGTWCPPEAWASPAQQPELGGTTVLQHRASAVVPFDVEDCRHDEQAPMKDSYAEHGRQPRGSVAPPPPLAERQLTGAAVAAPLVVEDVQSEGRPPTDSEGHERPAETIPCGNPPEARGAPPIVVRPCTDEEREKAWAFSGFYATSSGHEAPLALWIVGPSAVGKSTLAAEVAPSFGIPELEQREEGDGLERTRLDAVVVDGAYFREVHSNYQAWVATDDWAAAYPAFKKTINAEKEKLLQESVRLRKNLIMPQTCLNLPYCLALLDDMAKQGYTNHNLSLVAPKPEVAMRGRGREKLEGKRYAPGEYDRSIAAIRPMIAACNGRYELLRVTQPPAGGCGSPTGAGGCTSPDGATAARLRTQVLSKGKAGTEAEIDLPDIPFWAVFTDDLVK